MRYVGRTCMQVSKTNMACFDNPVRVLNGFGLVVDFIRTECHPETFPNKRCDRSQLTWSEGK